MPGDYTRFTFNPFEDHFGVLMQQGRVMVDSDFNEGVEMLGRQFRVRMLDTVGRCVVPRETLEGFRIQIVGNSITIGRGRAYIHGILAENHGADDQGVPVDNENADALEYDPILEEQRGVHAVAYESQPYLPNAADIFPVSPNQDPQLVYLDVWQRELTHVQEPDLVEKAVGVDTATRVQVVWQVKVLSNLPPGTTCDTPDENIPEWLDIIQPSAGRLTTAAVGVPASDDPCIIAPAGGFRGTENRLYRVEVHEGGPAATATFKWSRDNASVKASVVGINGAQDVLTVSRIGRDAVQRFATDDWIEIIDDHLELAQQPGAMRKILFVDEVNETITLDTALPAGMFNQPNPGARHTRIRRWDQKGQVLDGANTVIDDVDTNGGLIQISAGGGSMVLEDGVQVTFTEDPAGGVYRTGDYWVFAARTVDASVETLISAPPKGIVHHYCRLALVTLPSQVDDCRTFWPPEFGDAAEGCCTAVVRPGEDIQAAINSLPAAGGCVCLKPGLHQIETSLRIENSNVELRGETRGSIIRQSSDDVTVLSIGNPAGLLITGVVVNNIQFEFDNSEIDGSSLAPLLDIDRCEQVTIRDCRFSYQRLEVLTGVRIGRSSRLLISHCDFDTVSVGVWVVSDSTALSILNNQFRVAPTDTGDAALVAVFLEDAFGASRVEGNEISGYVWGIALNRNLLDPEALPSSGATGTIIADNRITRTTVQVDETGRKVFAIDVAAANCLIQGNNISYASDIYGGIRIFGNHCRVEQNRLFFSGRQLDDQPAIGIQFGVLMDENTGVLSHGRIRRNRISGPQHAIVVYQNEGIEIENNHINTLVGQVGFAIVLIEVDRACVADNRVSSSIFGIALSQGTDNHITGNELKEGGAGVSALSQTAFEFSQNRIKDMRNWGFLGLQFIGKTSLTENRIVSCGYDQTPAIGIGISGVFGDLHVESCEVMNTGVSPDEVAIRQPAWGIFADLVLECLIQGNIVTHSNSGLLDINLEDRALWLRGLLDFALQLTDQQTLVFGFSAQVANNKFLGPGFSALVEFQQLQISDLAFIRFQSVLFHDNFLWHISTVPDDSSSRASVVFRCREFSMTGCHVKATTALPSVDAQNRPGIFMGNITTGGTINFTEFPNPETGFNR